jgi:amidase
LAGVPFAVKDTLPQAGRPLGFGSRMLDGFVARRNATLADRFGAAGLVSLVRSATPEFAFNIDTAPVTHGPTRNPWNPEHGPGGSSGGSAALVASRAVPMAHANDAGGTACRVPSLRPPSSKHSPHRSSTRSPHHHEVGNHLTGSPSESGRLRLAARLERSALARAVAQSTAT